MYLLDQLLRYVGVIVMIFCFGKLQKLADANSAITKVEWEVGGGFRRVK